LCIHLFEWKQRALQTAWNGTNGPPFEDGIIRDARAGLQTLFADKPSLNIHDGLQKIKRSNMQDVSWYWIASASLIGMTALYLAFRLSNQRWPRVMAATAAGVVVCVYAGDVSALRAILLSGAILTICSATAQRK